MKDSDQVLLSRYVDGDLSPLERKRVESILESDPMAQRLVSDYGSLHRFVAELPRESVDLDLVPQIHEAMARRSWPWAIVTKSPAVAGIMAASVLLCCFSIAGWLVFNDRNYGGASGIHSTVVKEFDSPGEKVDVTEIMSLTEGEAPSALSPVVTESDPVASGPMQVAIARTPASSTPTSDKLDGRTTSPSSAELIRRNASDNLKDFIARSKPVDRHHAFRLHVDALSKRQIDNVVGLIARFRAAETPVLRADEKRDDGHSSIEFVALIPTKNVDDLQKELRKISSDLEFDMPVIPNEGVPIDRTGHKHIEDAELATAEANLRTELAEEGAGDVDKGGVIAGEHKRPGQDPVGDAIRLSLQAGNDPNAPQGTLDEVVIVIRTDLLSGEKAKAESSKKAPRPKR